MIHGKGEEPEENVERIVDVERSDTSIDKAIADEIKTNTNFSKEIQQENWLKTYWRPMMGWLYMLICLMDFVVFPIFAMILPVILKSAGVIKTDYVPWQSLTLSNGGLLHLAFGAILGITAWTRGQEKLFKIQ